MASVIYLSASVGAFFNADYYRKITDDFFSNAGLIYVAGFITALIGFLIVNYHNRWAKKLDGADYTSWLARPAEGHLFNRVSAIHARFVRTNVCRFRIKDLSLRYSLPRIIVRLLWVCIDSTFREISSTGPRG